MAPKLCSKKQVIKDFGLKSQNGHEENNPIESNHPPIISVQPRGVRNGIPLSLFPSKATRDKYYKFFKDRTVVMERSINLSVFRDTPVPGLLGELDWTFFFNILIRYAYAHKLGCFIQIWLTLIWFHLALRPHF